MARILPGTKTASDYPYRKCYECENIQDCPHPEVDEKGSPCEPEDCVRKGEIILTKKEHASI